MNQNIREALNEGPMTRFQWLAIATCIALIMLDGFDVLVIAFTAANIAADWKLNGAQLGVLFSAGLIGMGVGSVILGPLADRLGRQSVILLCLVIVSLGMAAAAFSQNVLELAVCRAITGLGIGGMLASVSVITAEFASNKWRSTAVALQATGYPIGATIGGSIAAVIQDGHGWRSVFIFGAVATAALIPLVLWRLPESIDFLLARRPAGALTKINTILRKMRHEPIASLPVVQQVQASAEKSPSGILKAEMRRPTLLLWMAFFLLMFSVYFALSWTPKMLVTAGLSARQGVTGGVLLNIGGIIGGSAFGALAIRMNLARLTAICLSGTAVSLAAFGFAVGQLGTAFAVACLMGIFLFGSMAGLYATASVLYPASMRATGMGCAIGVGRIGAILAPLLAGFLVDGGWATSSIYCAYALPLFAATVAILALRGRIHRGISAARPTGHEVAANLSART